MHVQTIDSEQVWQSPDGEKKIWEVAVRTDEDKTYRLKTYSRYIAKPGFEGEVSSYEARGQRFVRQLPSKQPAKAPYGRDDSAIRAQWAIGQAINLASVKMDKDAITLPVIEDYAKELFETVSRVKGEAVTPALRAEAESHIRGMAQVPLPA
jgi:hypothetical protein